MYQKEPAIVKKKKVTFNDEKEIIVMEYQRETPNQNTVGPS